MIYEGVTPSCFKMSPTMEYRSDAINLKRPTLQPQHLRGFANLLPVLGVVDSCCGQSYTKPPRRSSTRDIRTTLVEIA